MIQAQLNRVVAQSTGESVETIKQLGFSFVSMPTLKWRPPRIYSQHKRVARGAARRSHSAMLHQG